MPDRRDPVRSGAGAREWPAGGPPRTGLSLKPAERLRWLEETMEALRRIRGRARAAPPLREGGRPDPAPGGRSWG